MNKLKSGFMLLIPLTMVAIMQAGPLKAIENTYEDRFLQKGALTDPNIQVIGIDEKTLSEYGAFDQWSRDKIADLINVLNEDPESKPAVIALDIGFYSEKDSATDDKLTEAVRNAGNVVLDSAATIGTVTEEHDDGSFSNVSKVILLEEPFEKLKDAAAATGHSNVQIDDDGIVRHAAGSLNYNGETVNSFDYEIVKTYTGEEPVSFAQSESFYIRYAGDPFAYYGTVGAGNSLVDVVEGKIPASAFKNSIVMVGAYASGMQDQYVTSIDKKTAMNGVEIHANVVQQMLDNVVVNELNLSQKIAVIMIVGLLAISLLVLIDTKIAVPLAIALGVAYVFGVIQVYESMHYILPIVGPIAGIAAVTFIQIISRYLTVTQEKKRIIASYGKYLSPEVAASIAESGEADLKLGGQKKDIAVLFVDIRSFTTLSEQLPPEKVVAMLDSYLAVTTKAIFDHQGTVDKFIGDATMGVFNAPLDLEDYTYKAVLAGLQMAENSKIVEETLPDDLKGRVGFGVGINCGEAVVGNIGTDFRMEYTAIGDTVNTASRLEGQAKAGSVVISEAVYERVKDRIRCEDLGKVRLKGKADEVQIYRALEVIKN